MVLIPNNEVNIDVRKKIFIFLFFFITEVSYSMAQDMPAPPVLTPAPGSDSHFNNTVISHPADEGDKTSVQVPVKTEDQGVPGATQQYEATIQENLKVDQAEVKKLLAEAYQPEPYRINCAPQALNSAAKINFSAYTIAILPSNLIDTPPLEVVVSALNATFPQLLNSTHKPALGSIIGKGVSSALATIPSFLTVAFTQSPTSLAPSFVSLASTAIPAINSGASEYETNRASMHEIRYYDGIFRDYEAHLNKINVFNQKHAGPTSEKFTNYNKLPLYADLIVNKESNNGKPIIQITNSLGQSWSYFLNCDSRPEISQEHQQAITLLDKLKTIINIPNP